MSSFQSKRITKTCRQINLSTPDKVFPLLCPVLEKEWIDGWEYEMIFSMSGVVEKGCVFQTLSHSNVKTTWYTTRHEPEQFIIEFVRVTPGEMIVRIYIRLSDNNNGTTVANIMYEYTPLSESGNSWIEKESDAVFNANMTYWENAINHYLQTGQKLLKS